MKSNRIANSAIVIALCLTVVSGLYLAYSENVGGIKQMFVNRERSKVTKVANNKALQISPTQVERKVMVQDRLSDNCHKQGEIAIPDLNIYLPIYDRPFDDNALKLGAQKLKAINEKNVEVDASMGSGNYILVAHNFNDGKRMFSPLQQYINKDAPYLVNGKLKSSNWLNGSPVFMANDQGIYKYKIVSQKAIPGNDKKVRETSEIPKLTIITCLFPSDENRIETRARLVKSWSWQNAPNKELNYFNHKYNLKK